MNIRWLWNLYDLKYRHTVPAFLCVSSQDTCTHEDMSRDICFLNCYVKQEIIDDNKNTRNLSINFIYETYKDVV